MQIVLGPVQLIRSLAGVYRLQNRLGKPTCGTEAVMELFYNGPTPRYRRVALEGWFYERNTANDYQILPICANAGLYVASTLGARRGRDVAIRLLSPES